MIRRYRFDPDLDEVVEIRNNYFEERPKGPNVVGDDLPGGLAGMRSMADGKLYDSKSRYLRGVRAAGAEVVGNDTRPAPKPKADPSEVIREVVKAREQIAGDWNGTRAWLEKQNGVTDWSKRNDR